MDGTLDEVRISSVTRSDAWLDTEYSNQNDPAGFYTVWSEETDDGLLTISSSVDQSFRISDPATPMAAIFVDEASSPGITATNDIRIRIPSGFNMTWDATDTTAIISGPAAAKVSTTVTYEDGDQTVAWVRLPSLPSGADKRIYLYYGYAGAPDQAPVWNAGFEAVWHLKEDPIAPAMRS